MDGRLSEHRVTPQCAVAAALDKIPLHVEVTGQGDPLVMLHGWGMHGGIWSDLAARLAQHFQVHCADLPGHGFSNAEKGEGGRGKSNGSVEDLPFPLPSSLFSLEVIVDRLSERFKAPLTLCGWSLGGQIALHWAMREPEKIKRLVLVTSTPCFAEREDWPFGMPRHILQQFADDLEKDHAATLRRFLGLQMRGSEQEREVLAVLRERLFNRGEPDMDALRGGLGILRDADMRAVLPKIMQPALVIAGERDKLSPPQAAQYLASRLPDARLAMIEGAAHAPFLSHPDEFVMKLRRFMEDKSD